MKKIGFIFTLICISVTSYAEEITEGLWIQRTEGKEAGIEYIEITTLELNKNGRFVKKINFDSPFADYLEIIYGKYTVNDDKYIETYEKYECFKNEEKESENIFSPGDIYESTITLLSENFLQIEFQDEDGEITVERYQRVNNLQ